jgi:hypothetical protein
MNRTIDRTAGAFLAALVLATGAASPAAPHDEHGNPAIERRTALVSEEVARQRLLTFGLKPVGRLRQAEGRFLATVTKGGRTMEVEIDQQSGVLREHGQALALGAAGRSPVLRDPASTFSREDIARTPVPIEPFAVERPEAIRPLGDQPLTREYEPTAEPREPVPAPTPTPTPPPPR